MRQMMAEIRDLLKKGLKGSLFLWLISFILTLVLTILSSALVTVIFKNIPGSRFGASNWVEILILNLFPLALTHIVSTLLQNFSTEPPARSGGESQHPMSYYGCTVILAAVAFVYFIAYLLLLYFTPLWRNAAIFGITAAVECLAFYSVFRIELAHEQARKEDEERTRRIREAKMARKAQRSHRGVSAGEPAGESRAKDGAPVR